MDDYNKIIKKFSYSRKPANTDSGRCNPRVGITTPTATATQHLPVAPMRVPMRTLTRMGFGSLRYQRFKGHAYRYFY